MVFVMLGERLACWLIGWGVRELELWRTSRARGRSGGMRGLHEGFSAWLSMYITLHTQGLKYRIRHMRGFNDVQSA